MALAILKDSCLPPQLFSAKFVSFQCQFAVVLQRVLRSAAAADVQTIAAALIAAINSLPSGAERVQLYRAVQDVTMAAKDTLTRMFARKHMLSISGSQTGCPSDLQYPTGLRCLRNPVVSSKDHPLPRKMMTNFLAFPSTRIRRMYFRAMTYRCSASIHGCADLGRQGSPAFVLVTQRAHLDGRQGTLAVQRVRGASLAQPQAGRSLSTCIRDRRSS